MKLQELQKKDIPLIQKIAARAYEEDPWTTAQYESDFSNEYTHFLGVYDEECVGYIHYQVFAQEGEILNLAVDPKAQGKNLGSLLIEAMWQKEEMQRCFLEVRWSNKKAQAVYQKQGFQKIGTRKNYYQNPKEDAILMERERN